MELWTNQSGISHYLGEYVENSPMNVTLPIIDFDEIFLISGILPKGLVLEDNTIHGTPESVSDTFDFDFTLRATKNDDFGDRSFFVKISGKIPPIWVTTGGELEINGSGNLVTDSIVSDYQFLAIDQDPNTVLEYFVSNGELPPGLVLTSDGVLRGIVGAEILEEGELYEYEYPYKHPSDFIMGYDSLYYDISNRFDTIYGIYGKERIGKRYEFQVSVTDGNTTPVPLDVYIEVRGDQYYLANSDVPITEQQGTLDQYDRKRVPSWITKNNLGFYKGNENIIIYLDCLDPDNMSGYLLYELLDQNPDDSVSTLPDGLVLDSDRGIIQGRSPLIYTNRVDFTFTIRARSLTNPDLISDRTFQMSLVDKNYTEFSWITNNDLGQYKIYDSVNIDIVAMSSNSNSKFYDIASGSLPNGTSLTQSGHLYGKILPFDELDESFVFEFDIRVRDMSNTIGETRSFSITVLDTTELPFTDVVARPYFSDDIRHQYRRIISNTNIFPRDIIYRGGIDGFGLCETPEIIIYSGIQTAPLLDFYYTVNGFKRTRYKISNVNFATAMYPGTNTIKYEVVYLGLIDPYLSSDSIGNNTISSLRKNIENLGTTNYHKERLWMNTVQTDSSYGYFFAIPLAYVKPGTGKGAANRILLSGYDFKDFDVDIDRIIVYNTINHEEPLFVFFPENKKDYFL